MKMNVVKTLALCCAVCAGSVQGMDNMSETKQEADSTAPTGQQFLAVVMPPSEWQQMAIRAQETQLKTFEASLDELAKKAGGTKFKKATKKRAACALAFVTDQREIIAEIRSQRQQNIIVTKSGKEIMAFFDKCESLEKGL